MIWHNMRLGNIQWQDVKQQKESNCQEEKKAFTKTARQSSRSKMVLKRCFVMVGSYYVSFRHSPYNSAIFANFSPKFLSQIDLAKWVHFSQINLRCFQTALKRQIYVQKSKPNWVEVKKNKEIGKTKSPY